MTPEDKPAKTTHDSSDGFVDAMAGLILIGLFVVTAVFWVSHQ